LSANFIAAGIAAVARHGALHQHLDDEHAVDFVVPSKMRLMRESRYARHTDIPRESRSAEDLHRFVHDEIQHLAAVNLGDGALDRILFKDFHCV